MNKKILVVLIEFWKLKKYSQYINFNNIVLITGKYVDYFMKFKYFLWDLRLWFEGNMLYNLAE